MKTLMTKFGIQLGQIRFNDVVFVAAVGALGYGIALIHPATAFIIIGLLFVILSTWGKIGSRD
jgi:hypothetical protein